MVEFGLKSCFHFGYFCLVFSVDLSFFVVELLDFFLFPRQLLLLLLAVTIHFFLRALVFFLLSLLTKRFKLLLNLFFLLLQLKFIILTELLLFLFKLSLHLLHFSIFLLLELNFVFL